VRAGVGNSDSHKLDERVGFGRTYVDAGIGLENFDVGVFNRALKDGKAIAGNGVIVDVEIHSGNERRGLGFEPYQPRAGEVLRIETRVPPWVPVEEIRVLSSGGHKVIASGVQLQHPADPLGVEGVVRFQATIPLEELLTPGVDDWLLVEAGLPIYRTGDLDDDGVPDTTDNNGDGVVNKDDVEEDEDTGPLSKPEDPTDESDARYSMARVLPGAWPYGFSNPFLIDWEGNGWEPPGVAP
jgi:hypothetical protein